MFRQQLPLAWPGSPDTPRYASPMVLTCGCPGHRCGRSLLFVGATRPDPTPYVASAAASAECTRTQSRPLHDSVCVAYCRAMDKPNWTMVLIHVGGWARG